MRNLAKAVLTTSLFIGLFAVADARAAIVTWTITGHLTYTQSQSQSDWVNEPQNCPGCGHYANTASAGDGSAVGVNAQVGDAFTMTYTFDTSVAPTNVYSYSENNPGYYDFDETYTQWELVPGRGSLSSTINGQTWGGPQRYSQVYGYQYDYDESYCTGCDTAHDNVYVDNYDYSYSFDESRLDYDGNPTGPYQYSYDYGYDYADPTNLGSVVDNPNGHQYYGQHYFNIYRNLYDSGAMALLLSGFPTTVDLSDYNGSVVQWYAYAYAGYDCGHAYGNDFGIYGQATYCQWDQYSQYSIQGVIESITSSYDQTGVPAPGALALLGVGLLGFGAMRRRLN